MGNSELLIENEERIEDLREALYEASEKLKNAIIIPEGATNGDMIKTMFPNVEYGKDILGNVFVISSAQLGYIVFRESWWNSLYKGECNLSEKPTSTRKGESE